MILLIAACGGLSAQQTGAQALSRWFAQSGSHQRYRSVEGDLLQVFREADAHQLPYSILIDRLNLGAARRLRPDALVAGMREELARLEGAARVVSSVEKSPDGQRLLMAARSADLLNAVSIYMSGGLSERLMREFLIAASKSAKSVDEVFRACAVLVTIERVGHFSDNELLEFGTALVDSAVNPSSYAAVGSFLVRVTAAGRGGSGMLRSAGQILRQGGGLPQLELELGRRQ